MKIIDRETGTEKMFTSRKGILAGLLQPIKEDFSMNSNTLRELIEKYKDEPLVPYVPTRTEKKNMELNPDYAFDIPKYYVKGYDDEVSNCRFDQKICNEFYERWEHQDKKLFAFINEKNPTYRIEY